MSTADGTVPGEIAFSTPTAASGWVAFLELSAHNGEVAKVTAVPVTFAAPLM